MLFYPIHPRTSVDRAHLEQFCWKEDELPVDAEIFGGDVRRVNALYWTETDKTYHPGVLTYVRKMEMTLNPCYPETFYYDLLSQRVNDKQWLHGAPPLLVSKLKHVIDQAKFVDKVLSEFFERESAMEGERNGGRAQSRASANDDERNPERFA